MNPSYQIVVCGTVVPDPLQTLEPVMSATGPALKNEALLPAVLDPWAAHALYEAAHLAKQFPGSKIWLVSLGPKNKLQQLMMNVAQKLTFELIAIDGPAHPFSEAAEVANLLSETISQLPGLDRSRLLLFGGWESASRGAGVTLQLIGECLGIRDQFQGVDVLRAKEDGSFEVHERMEGGKHQVSQCAGPPMVLGWATGHLPEPKNNPQLGMQNMRTVLPAIQRAKSVKPTGEGLEFKGVTLPQQMRSTEIIKNKTPQEIARELLSWIVR